MNDPDPLIALTGDPLDRCDALRKIPGEIEKFCNHPDTLYMVLRGSEILLQPDGQLALVASSILSELELGEPETLFLGVETTTRRPWFVISPDQTSDISCELLENLGQWVHLREALSLLPAPDLAIAGRSVSLFHWHRAHRFCANCGQQTRSAAGGEKRICKPCEREHFPRVDPAVIMLVTHQDTCLLGRNANWPQGRYSTLAGFVEPGESIEEACRREVMEEVGVTIGTVTYAFSQPWPFPHSIMVGLIAEALTTEITLEEEMAEARWFTSGEITSMLDGTHPKYPQPFSEAASGVLLQNWADQNR